MDLGGEAEGVDLGLLGDDDVEGGVDGLLQGLNGGGEAEGLDEGQGGAVVDDACGGVDY